MLKPNGLLIIFEPNNEFLPRQIVLNTFIKRLVYFDEEEKALIGNHISSLFSEYGLKRLYQIDHNPPYNINFLKKLKFGLAFYPITESLYQLEKRFSCKEIRDWSAGEGKSGVLNRGSYIFGIYRNNK